MAQELALCSVVTAGLLEEFLLLKLSVELFHHREYQWFVRCDEASAEQLGSYSNIRCTIFRDHLANRPHLESKEFRTVVAEKMAVLEDAWTSHTWNSVAFLDADLILTAPFLESLHDRGSDLILTPNYYPVAKEYLIPIHGYYNSGFVVTRTQRFHNWWRGAFENNPSQFTDQWSLNSAEKHFTVCQLGPRANVGFWRSDTLGEYLPIDIDCLFLHVHMFQPLRTHRDWIDKSFALHCVKFLSTSPVSEHRSLLNEILSRDKYGWYKCSLELTR